MEPTSFMFRKSPAAGIGGAYAGLQLEKIVVSYVALVGGTSPIFTNAGGFNPAPGTVTPPAPQLIRDAQDNNLTGTAAADRMEGREGNDTILSLGGNECSGGAGNDRIDAGQGNDIVSAGATAMTGCWRCWCRPDFRRRRQRPAAWWRWPMI